MNIQIFSLPQQFVIPHQDWLKTPDVNARANQAAHSYFANWTINQVGSAKTLAGVVCVISFVGLALAGWIGVNVARSTGVVKDILFFPRFLAINGLMFIVCLIGYKAMRRELIVRLEKTCLAIEDWLIPLKKTYEDLEALGAPFTNRQQPNHPVPFDTYQSIYNLLEQLPADAIQSIDSFADELNALHLALFGDLRRFGQRVQRTNAWIDNSFKRDLRNSLRELHCFGNCFKDNLVKLQNDPQNIDLQKQVHASTHVIYKYHKPALLEQSRQSIAAFRSSLKI